MEYRRLPPPLDGYKVYEDGSVWSDKSSRWIRSHVINSGYVSVTLWGNNKAHQWLAHRLVATLFIPNPNGCEYVNHIDSNRLNNHVSNLEWCTPAENNHHARAKGRYNDCKAVVCINDETGDTVMCDSMTEACKVVNAKLELLSRIINGKRSNLINGWWVERLPDKLS